MGNHTVECEICGWDLRGLSGGHAPDCGKKPHPTKRTEKKKIKRGRHKAQTLGDAIDIVLAAVHAGKVEISCCATIQEGEPVVSFDLSIRKEEVPK